MVLIFLPSAAAACPLGPISLISLLDQGSPSAQRGQMGLSHCWCLLDCNRTLVINGTIRIVPGEGIAIQRGPKDIPVPPGD